VKADGGTTERLGDVEQAGIDSDSERRDRDHGGGLA
jgi:hypothetical protein